MVSKGHETWKILLRNVENFGPDVDFIKPGKTQFTCQQGY